MLLLKLSRSSVLARHQFRGLGDPGLLEAWGRGQLDLKCNNLSVVCVWIVRLEDDFYSGTAITGSFPPTTQYALAPPGAVSMKRRPS